VSRVDEQAGSIRRGGSFCAEDQRAIKTALPDIVDSMMSELQTERLILRPLQLADAEQTRRLFPQWEIVKFLNARVPWPYPEDRAFYYYGDVAAVGTGSVRPTGRAV
jgi:hypothetical protein